MLDRFADIGRCRKVHDAIETGQQRSQFHGVADIAFYQLMAFREFAETGAKIVVDYDVITTRLQFANGMGTDISRTTCNQYPHCSFSAKRQSFELLPSAKDCDGTNSLSYLC